MIYAHKIQNYGNVLKRKQILLLLKEKYEITEEKGILSIEFIVKTVSNILKEYNDVSKLDVGTKLVIPEVYYGIN